MKIRMKNSSITMISVIMVLLTIASSLNAQDLTGNDILKKEVDALQIQLRYAFTG